jgi:hypothetical protein
VEQEPVPKKAKAEPARKAIAGTKAKEPPPPTAVVVDLLDSDEEDGGVASACDADALLAARLQEEEYHGSAAASTSSVSHDDATVATRLQQQEYAQFGGAPSAEVAAGSPWPREVTWFEMQHKPHACGNFDVCSKGASFFACVTTHNGVPCMRATRANTPDAASALSSHAAAVLSARRARRLLAARSLSCSFAAHAADRDSTAHGLEPRPCVMESPTRGAHGARVRCTRCCVRVCAYCGSMPGQTFRIQYMPHTQLGDREFELGLRATSTVPRLTQRVHVSTAWSCTFVALWRVPCVCCRHAPLRGRCTQAPARQGRLAQGRACAHERARRLEHAAVCGARHAHPSGAARRARM